jgi:hypothetical protein
VPAAAALGERRLRDRGFVTIEYLIAVGLSLVVLIVVVNLVVWEYGRGVVATAVDQGARSGARVAVGQPAVAEAACEQAGMQVIDDLLGGPAAAMGRGVSLSCTEQGGEIQAVARTHFDAWFRALPGWSFTARGTAAVEPSG